MHIGILILTPSSSTRDRRIPDYARMLRDEAKKQGYRVSIIRFDRCQMVWDQMGPRVLYQGKKFPDVDIVIPRIGIRMSNLIKISIVKQIQMMGIPVVNSFLPISRAKDKLRTMQILSYNGIPIPKTVVVNKLEYLDTALKKIGTLPVILKTSFGSLGVGVAIVESRRSLISALDVFWSRLGNDIIMMQEYIKESEGKDIRVFVVGGKIIASMERKAKEGEFRSNIHRGGTGAPVKLTNYEKKLALRAVKALKLDVAGVDLLEKKGGAVVMEVNCNPGLESITETTGVNVSSAVIKYAVEKARLKKSKVEY
ncbi:MAG: RimK family alpha-L-glutamate ligase [Patescibacteria group bacterium]|nr:RimK family alpha-L-glutamate ligase [Patescibacteria group bacterium]